MNSKLQSIDYLLKQFDLSDHERTVFCAGLSSWPSTIIQLAQQADLHRLTVHQVVQSMIEKGLFLETYSSKKRLVYPNSSDGLTLMLEEQKRKLRHLEQQLESAKDIFHYLRNKRDSDPMTRLYRGIEGMNVTLMEMAKDGYDIAVLYDAQSLQDVIDESLYHRSYQQRQKQGIHTRLLLPDSFRDYRHVEWKEDYNITIKVLPSQQIIQWGIEIWGSKVALHSYKERDITTTIIDNAPIASMLLVMYQSMRSSAKDYQEQFLVV